MLHLLYLAGWIALATCHRTVRRLFPTFFATVFISSVLNISRFPFSAIACLERGGAAVGRYAKQL